MHARQHPARLVVSLAIVLLAPMLITPAVAVDSHSSQSMYQTTPPNESTTNNSTTTVGNGSHWVGNGSSGGGFGLMPDIPGPKEFSKAAVDYLVGTWLIQQLTQAFKDFINAFTGFIVGTPYPTNNGYLGIFGYPVESSQTQLNWHGLFWKIYVPYVGTISMMLLVLNHMYSAIKATTPGINGSMDGTDLFLKTTAGGLFIGLWWQIGTALAHLNNEIALVIAPSGAEMVGSLNGLIKIGSGALLTIVLTKGIGLTEVGILAFIYGIRHTLVMLYQICMPLLIVLALTFPLDRGRRFFGSLAWHYVTLLILVYPAAFLLRFGLVLKADFGFGPIGDAIVGMGFLGAAILSVGVLGWTSIATRRYARKMGSGVANSSPTRQGMEERFDRTRQRKQSATDWLHNRRQKLRGVRTDGGTPEDSTPTSAKSPITRAGSTTEMSSSRRSESMRKRRSRASNREWSYTAPSNRAGSSGASPSEGDRP